jgi:aspartyl protease family protein
MNGSTKLLIACGAIALAASAAVARLDASRTESAPATRAAQAPAATPPERAAGRTTPAQGAAGAPVSIQADRFGQFSANVEIDGRRLKMLVDTGATFLSLSHDDAASMGLRPLPHEFTMPLITASGELKAARTRLREVRVNGVVAYDVPAIVMPKGAGATSLLGMSFLSKLRGFEVASGQLLLKP